MRAERPLPKSYKAELDISTLLGDEESSEYQQLIGILRWAVELGRIDIALEVSYMSSYLCAPRKGHMEAAPINMPEALGNPVVISVFVDADHDVFQPQMGQIENSLPSTHHRRDL
eukprot:scaffold129973_cov34-Attheya_sp.AAC.1